MAVSEIIFKSIKKIIKDDRGMIVNLLYYSLIEAILVLSIPLTSSFVINSVIAHAEISVYVLGIIVIILFVVVTILQLIKEYIVEKFQQKIFLTTAIDISLKATATNLASSEQEAEVRKYMNYFFDITAIQKFFPILLLDGVGIVIKIIVSLLLLWFFDPTLFTTGVLFFTAYLVILMAFGKNGFSAALDRSDAKHNAIYFLQNIHTQSTPRVETLAYFDKKLLHYVRARQALFKIIARQMGLTFISEGIVFSGFLVIGGYLVIEGRLPIGEFIAAEIVVVSIIYALKGFIKQLDYIYDTIEGFYKVDKLTKNVGEKR
jgi:ABC-type bacteriocin/lantibiotic exporter with double-glycine peptidase domain